jgi:hypothetical protein
MYTESTNLELLSMRKIGYYVVIGRYTVMNAYRVFTNSIGDVSYVGVRYGQRGVVYEG